MTDQIAPNTDRQIVPLVSLEIKDAMRRVAAGETAARSILVTLTRKTVRGRIRGELAKLGAHHVEADDVEQDTWISVLRYAPTYRGPKVTTWLCAIATNAANGAAGECCAPSLLTGVAGGSPVALTEGIDQRACLADDRLDAGRKLARVFAAAPELLEALPEEHRDRYPCTADPAPEARPSARELEVLRRKVVNDETPGGHANRSALWTARQKIRKAI